ncbi:hypothetical protein IPZ58_11390 [Streptomyces roseoverticillatus]|uniref:hypothetical protein n=1 Tax=Streptomyces roseoverticillatus TaxID=66429 RepID=UPI001F481BA8|nr:hypothetical protein [Streptomyces roseoverticillatus]MCF3102189.1 hypothetical protein [Streptomyces roseoverticillatus]
MSGRRDEKPAGRGKAVPRDMQDQQARVPPERGTTGPPTRRGRKNAEASDERTDRTADKGEAAEDEPPD